MITQEEMDEVIQIDGEGILGDGGIRPWLEANGIPDEVFIKVCGDLANALKLGLMEAVAKHKLMGAFGIEGEEDMDEGDVVELSVSAGMGVAFVAGWTCHKRLGNDL